MQFFTVCFSTQDVCYTLIKRTTSVPNADHHNFWVELAFLVGNRTSGGYLAKIILYAEHYHTHNDVTSQ